MKHNQGFTIIELLVASLVFATILTLVSVGLLQVGKVYYKGVTTTRTQETTRDIMDTISRTIQFDGGTVTPITVDGGTNLSYFCINNDRYTFTLGKQLTDDTSPGPNQSNHVLVKDSAPCGGSADFGALSPTATELMATRMRLVKLQLNNLGGSLYSVTVRVVSGDDDLLCSPGVPGDCNLTTPTTNLDKDDLTCKSITGGQFCAPAQLQAAVQKRI